jgi:hypothetical protein
VSRCVGGGVRLGRYCVCTGADAGPVGRPIFLAVLVTVLPAADAARSMALLAAFAPRLTVLSVRAATPEAALAADCAAFAGPAAAAGADSAATTGSAASRRVVFMGVPAVVQSRKMIATVQGT